MGEKKGAAEMMESATKCLWLILLLMVIFLGQPSLGMSPSVPRGFKANIFRRGYSQLSPVHDHLQAMINHSINRSNYFNSNLDQEPIGVIYAGNVDYIIEFDIGTNPSKTFHLNIDTGSHITWVQHKNCITCIDKSDESIRYDDRNSSTAEELSCYDNECNKDGTIKCDDYEDKCTYVIKYQDGTNSSGLMYLDRFTFLSIDESNVALEGVRLGGAFYCTQGAFNHDIEGIFGLSRNPRSFISQNGFLKFSYCLPNYRDVAVARSNMMFGTAVSLVGNSTALEPHPNFYVVSLNGISVSGKRLWLDPSVFRFPDGRAATIVDTGTPLTRIPKQAYDEVVQTLKSIIKLPLSPRKDDMLCFKGGLNDIDKLALNMTLHFEGLDLPITPRSLFYMASNNVFCLTMLAQKNNWEYSIFGATLQQNINIAFDIGANKIFMSPMTCASVI